MTHKIKQDGTIKDVRLFARIASIFPIISSITFLLSLLVAVLYFGHAPAYGVDNDIHGINSIPLNILYFINFLSFAVSFITVIAWSLLLMHLFINKIKMSRQELLFHFFSAFSIFVFLISKFGFTTQYEWFYD